MQGVPEAQNDGIKGNGIGIACSMHRSAYKNRSGYLEEGDHYEELRADLIISDKQNVTACRAQLWLLTCRC
jgi:hypothetical protein